MFFKHVLSIQKSLTYNINVENQCITVLVERITYSNPQNGYSVLRATSKGYPDGITVVGNFGPVHPGEELRVYGTWTCHPQFGLQFHSFKYTTMKPATLKGIEKYLGSGLIKGIGPVTAKRLVAAFGKETLEVIENNPEKLSSCEGIGPYRSNKIISGWSQQKSIQDVMIFLQGNGISTAYAVKIFKTFGNDAIKKVTENPYMLAYEIWGIGFKTADKIASEFGIHGPDPRRLEAGIIYVLSTGINDGHLFFPRDDLLKKAAEILEVQDLEAIDTAVKTQQREGRLIILPWENRDLVYLPFAFRDEKGSADRCEVFFKKNAPLEREKLLYAVDKANSFCQTNLSDSQALAVEISLNEKILIITGGPGTGKTTALRALVEAHKVLGRTVLLASPTGRAAKRLSEVTGSEAKTIHRLLEFCPSENRFKHDRANPLNCNTLVIDEASMVDMGLFHSLLKAIPDFASLVLVGDSDQLPSVGPGLVLRHLIESNVFPVIKLNSIFRQGQSSLIITNAHRINKGQMPIMIAPDGQAKTDCYFLEASDNDKCLSLLKNVVSSSLPKKFGYNPIEDIQVLTPMNRSSLGAINLNKVLQEALNPPSPSKIEFQHMHRIFREGDKVIQNKNNYDLEVFNGDIGIIRKIEREDQELIIEFSQGERVFQPADLLDLSHAFATTVHKSQGSEYQAVVLLLATQHYMMLQRNLIYTGITRAKKTMVLLGSKRAIWLGTKNDKIQTRNSIFKDLLIENFSRFKGMTTGSLLVENQAKGR